MPNLRSMIDGFCSLEINSNPILTSNVWKPNDDFMIRRKVNRSGPNTSEVLVGKILAMNGDNVEVNIQKQGGSSQRATLKISDLQPVTDSFKRQSMQYNTSIRPRV